MSDEDFLPEGYEFLRDEKGAIVVRDPACREPFIGLSLDMHPLPMFCQPLIVYGGKDYGPVLFPLPTYGPRQILRKLAPANAPAPETPVSQPAQEPESPGAGAGEPESNEDALTRLCDEQRAELALQAARIENLERMAADDARRWAQMNAENATLKLRLARIESAVNGTPEPERTHAG